MCTFLAPLIFQSQAAEVMRGMSCIILIELLLEKDASVRLSSGHLMPLHGFGVYKNYDAKSSVLEAFKAGYRHV